MKEMILFLEALLKSAEGQEKGKFVCPIAGERLSSVKIGTTSIFGHDAENAK